MLNKKRNNSSKCKETFLLKLHEILENSDYKKVISWGNEDNVIMISDSHYLSNNILPKFYKHSNFPSFVRQLNKYGFKKIKSLYNSKVLLFRHNSFSRHISLSEIQDIGKNQKEVTKERKDSKYEFLANQIKEQKDKNETMKKELLDKIGILSNENEKLKNELLNIKKSLININKSSICCKFSYLLKKIIFKSIIRKIRDYKKNILFARDYPIDFLSEESTLNEPKNIFDNIYNISLDDYLFDNSISLKEPFIF
jgi:hypothetical protein